MIPDLHDQAPLARENTIEELRHKLAFYKLLDEVAARFHACHEVDIDEAITHALRDIGIFVGADRTYLFMFSRNQLLVSNTHEWCAEGITAQKDQLQNLAAKDYSWFFSQLDNGDYFYIPSVADLPAHARTDQLLLEMQQIKSLLLVPLRRFDKTYGFLGFDAVSQTCEWSAEDINLLTILAKIILMAKSYQQSRDFVRISRQMANNITEGVFIFREPNKVLWVNEAFTAITGYTFEDVISKPYFLKDLVVADQEAVQEMHQQLRSHGIWSGTLNSRHKDGRCYPASFFINRNREENTKWFRYIAVFKDVSEDYKLEQERSQLKKQTITAQKLNSLSAMSAAVVHEIAQPLNAIKVLVDGMLYFQHNQYELPQSEIFQKLADVSTEIRRIDEIIQSIRSYASSNQSTELSACRWHDAIERVLGLLGRQLATHQIIINLVLAKDLPQMYANPLRLDEVLINLLVNAMNALDWSHKRDKEIICRTLSTGTQAILEVADNAYGIDESLHEMIFEPFFTDHHGSHGMGLGLSIVASIVSSLKGHVSVYNNEKGGATFRVELPTLKNYPAIGILE